LENSAPWNVNPSTELGDCGVSKSFIYPDC
jgi:hypothetical protein